MSVSDPTASAGERLTHVLEGLRSRATLARLLACIGGGLVLSLMVGQHEGNSQAVDGSSFEAGLLHDFRYLIFGAVGVVLFLLITFWPVVQPFVRSPGAVGVGAGFVVQLVAMLLLKWFDGTTSKFNSLSDLVGKTPALGFPSAPFFGWLGYLLWFGALGLGIAAVATRNAVVAWVLAAVGVFGAFCAFYGHHQVVDLAESQYGPDHSLGVWVATLGYLITALTGVVIARSKVDAANPRESLDRALAWRPGLLVTGSGSLLILIALLDTGWIDPLARNYDYGQLVDLSSSIGMPAIATAWFGWLGIVVMVLAPLIGAASALRRLWVGGAVAALLALFGLVVNFYSMHELSSAGTRQLPAAGKLWQNLGSGGWVLCIGLSLLITGGAITATAARRASGSHAATEDEKLPLRRALRRTSSSPLGRTALPVAIALALFYPPTLTGEWQNTLVTQIGPYLLLAVGLNVVIGWAGLLDLGYIAFYAVGAYTTAYFTGSLPIKPPSWLDFFSSPLWSIPFAVLAALIAGVLLGAPTLRLRGDYLAIVTLGFGEIIQVVATNNPGNLTGGARGPTVPNPVFDVHLFSIHFGQDSLPYWYLLLVLLVIVVVLFFRLEGSRIGRAWAAIREDEIAAQASGVNTTKVKLLAFAIGASTSGLAGVFFASQVGYFDPSLFTLQNSILIVAYVVFGGMGSLPGALAGAAVLTWLPQFLKSQVPQTDLGMWIGALILLMMIFRPAGLIPARRRAAELGGLDAPDSSEVRAVPAGEGM